MKATPKAKENSALIYQYSEIGPSVLAECFGSSPSNTLNLHQVAPDPKKGKRMISQ